MLRIIFLIFAPGGASGIVKGEPPTEDRAMPLHPPTRRTPAPAALALLLSAAL